MGRGAGAVTIALPRFTRNSGRAAVQIFATNDRINQVLIKHLDLPSSRTLLPRTPEDVVCPYSLTIEKITMGMSARNSHADA
jgi:hypothetical protein